MKRPMIFPFIALLMVGCISAPTQQAEERAAMVQGAVVHACAANVAVIRFSDDAVLSSFSMSEETVAEMKGLLKQSRPSVYEPDFVSPPAPPLADIYLCIGDMKLNLESVWSESREASELEWLRKCDGAGRLAPQIVLPDAAYERFMALDAVQQARAALKRLENESR